MTEARFCLVAFCLSVMYRVDRRHYAEEEAQCRVGCFIAQPGDCCERWATVALPRSSIVWSAY